MPIELAGRGIRRRLSFYEGMNEAAEDVIEQLMSHAADGEPYALFGHSMGGMIAYEAAHLVHERRLPPPQLVIFSGRPAPHVVRSDADIHGQPDAEFMKRIEEMGATSAELFADSQLRAIFLPVLRADFRLVETYEYIPRLPLPYPFLVVAGTTERWSEEELEGWRLHTSAACRVMRLEGGHFYWNGNPEPITSLLMEELQQLRLHANIGWEGG
ncbi:thioesterase [Paenibacillus sp. CCS19]|nr:thioesterase [Paenibacillus cellulosilyticus]